MYSPYTDFVPFIREVDQCVKEIVNEKCFLEFGDTIVKVRLLLGPAHALLRVGRKNKI